MKKKYAYITLLSSIDYLEAVLVLNRSLRAVKSKYPFVVAITREVYKHKEIISILTEENIIIEHIPTLLYNPATQKALIEKYHLPHLLNVGSKIEIFNLTNYDKLVYLDADSLVVKNIDNLFKKQDGSTLVENHCAFNAMFVCEPRNHPYALYKFILQEGYLNDGALMEELWWHIKSNKTYHISSKYFYYPYLTGELMKGIKVYHLQNQELKFWKLKVLPTTKLAALYQTFLYPIRQKYSVYLKLFQKN